MFKLKIIFIVISMIGVIGLTTNMFFSSSESNFLSNTTSYILKPAGRFFSNIGWSLKSKVQFFTSISSLKGDNQKLFDENLELKARIAKLTETEKENDILREEMLIAPRKKYNLESAMIIGKELGNYSEVVYIDKGQKNGIKKGMTVLVGKGILIGLVIEASVNTAKIELVTDKNFKVNVKLVESNGHGVLFGQYGTSATMKMIPQTIKVNKGDTIVTSELSDVFEKDLLIGYVQEIFNTEDGLFQEVTVTLPKDLEDLHIVHVLLK